MGKSIHIQLAFNCMKYQSEISEMENKSNLSRAITSPIAPIKSKISLGFRVNFRLK